MILSLLVKKVKKDYFGEPSVWRDYKTVNLDTEVVQAFFQENNDITGAIADYTAAIELDHNYGKGANADCAYAKSFGL